MELNRYNLKNFTLKRELIKRMIKRFDLVVGEVRIKGNKLG